MGRRPIDAEIREAAFNLLDKFRTPAEAEANLLEQYGSKAPSRRTIERYRRLLAPRDPSGPWVLSEEADRNGWSLVPEVLAAVIEKSSGRRNHVTVAEAKWISRTRLAAPDLDPWYVWLIARSYVRKQQRGEKTTNLDLFLSFAPWRSEEASGRYRRAVWQGWVPRPPVLLESLVKSGLGPGPDVIGPHETERYLESLTERKEDTDEKGK